MLDRDPALLALVAERTAGTRDRDGTPVDVATRHDEITSLTARDLAGISAVTASALVDLLTADEIGQPRRDVRRGAGARPDHPDRHRAGRDRPTRPGRRTRSPRLSTPTSAGRSQAARCSARTPPRPPSKRSSGPE